MNFNVVLFLYILFLYVDVAGKINDAKSTRRILISFTYLNFIISFKVIYVAWDYVYVELIILLLRI